MLVQNGTPNGLMSLPALNFLFKTSSEKSWNASQIVCGSFIGPLRDRPVLGPRIVSLVAILVFPCFFFKNNCL